jgi:hypothetical protein
VHAIIVTMTNRQESRLAPQQSQTVLRGLRDVPHMRQTIY